MNEPAKALLSIVADQLDKLAVARETEADLLRQLAAYTRLNDLVSFDRARDEVIRLAQQHDLSKIDELVRSVATIDAEAWNAATMQIVSAKIHHLNSASLTTLSQLHSAACPDQQCPVHLAIRDRMSALSR